MSSNTSHCIEWHKVKDIFDIRGGYTPSKSNKEYWSDGQIPWFVMEDIRESGRKLSEAKQKVAECAVKRGALFPIDSILLATSATVGEHAILKTAGIANQRFANLALKDSFKSKLKSDFLFYYMFIVDEWCKKNTNISGFASVDMSKLKELLLPIPPLEKQERIVAILDKYSSIKDQLTKQLDREIELTLKQYAYYRELLLCPSEHSQRKTVDMFLGNIVKIKNGKAYKHLSEGSIPVYGSGGVMTYVNQFSYDKPSVLIPRKGSLGNLFYLDKPFWNVDTIFYTVIDTNLVVPKFLFYLLQVQHLERMNQAGGVPSLTQSMLNKLQLPIPSLEEQQRIVAILDKYSESVEKLVSNLRREKELVQKQYEYYREKLLTF